VADELVGEAERAILDFAVADDDGALVGGAADEAHVAEHGFVFAKAEGAGGGDEAGVVAGFEVAGEGFVADGRGEVDGVVDGVAFAGVDADEFRAFADFYGFEDAEVLALAALALEAGGVDGLDVGVGGAVEDGNFEVVDFHDDVVYAEADEGGEEVLGGGDEDALAHEGGGVGDFGDVASGGRDLEVIEIGAAEDDAGAGGRGDEAEGDFGAGVEAYAAEIQRGGDGLLELGFGGQGFLEVRL